MIKHRSKHTFIITIYQTILAFLFRGLFAFANTWLSQNRHYSMLQIESIESRVGLDGREVEDGKTIEHTSVFGANGLLRGIR